MNTNNFRRPLMQSAAVLATVIIVATIAGSSGSGGSGGNVLSVIAGIGNLILFVIGLALGLGFCIAFLVGIFLAAIALVSKEQASIIYSNLKNKCYQGISICKNSWSCCDMANSTSSFDLEKYNRLSQDLNHFQEINATLAGKLNELEEKNCLLAKSIEKLHAENSILKTTIEESNNANNQKQPATTGIFSHIDKDEYRTLFTEKVEEALKQELTYAQIDEYLSKTLPPGLIKIIKNHPSLTKNYIRSLRKE